MKCQKCDKTAIMHITEISGNQVISVHFCPECAENYLNSNSNSQQVGSEGIQGLTGQLSLTSAGQSSSNKDKDKVCPVCGITFQEFRDKGRLGCPNDYTFFEEELEPLLMNVHGELEHCGKTPATTVPTLDLGTSIIKLRRAMKEAIDAEDYERASKLRDQIRTLEKEILP